MASILTDQSKIALVKEKEQLLSIKRRYHCEYDFSLFIATYLPHLTPATTPVFHHDMRAVMERSILTHNEISMRGGIAPTTLLDRDTNISHPQIFSNNSESNTTTQQKEEYVNRVLFIAPRGFAKSTLCSRLFALWIALYKKKVDTFLVSATISLAKENMRIIREELEGNEKILRDFGNQKSDKWTEEHLMLNNGVQLRAKGRGFQIRGFRPDLIVCDDLEDEESIYSKDQRDKLEYWFFRTLMPALKPNQTLFYVGTKLHQFSLMGKLEKKDEFEVREYKALKGGKSIWEEWWPTETLLKLKREIGSYAFEAEFQNNPLSLEDQPVKPHFLEGVKVEGDCDISCLSIDPAISIKQSSDYRAFVVMGKTDKGFKEIFSEHGRWGIDDQIDRIIDLYVRYKPTRVIIEEVAFQKIYRKLLLDKARERGLYIPVTTAILGVGSPRKPNDKRPKDKFTRLMSIVHLFEQKLVEIQNPDLKEELIAFPSGDHDDLVDATVYALYWLLNYQRGKYMFKKEEVKLIKAQTSFYVNEVRPGVFMAEAGHSKIPTPSKILNYERKGG